MHENIIGSKMKKWYEVPVTLNMIRSMICMKTTQKGRLVQKQEEEKEREPEARNRIPVERATSEYTEKTTILASNLGVKIYKGKRSQADSRKDTEMRDSSKKPKFGKVVKKERLRRQDETMGRTETRLNQENMTSVTLVTVTPLHLYSSTGLCPVITLVLIARRML